MRIRVVSMFRDAPDHQVKRWVAQVRELAAAAAREGHEVTALAYENDSVDDTVDRIYADKLFAGCPIDVASDRLGTRRFGSVEDPARMAALSRSLNLALDAAVARPADVYVYVESDLVWDPATFLRLAGRIDAVGRFDVVAPLVFAGMAFYDVWGFRKDGDRFSPFPPYHPKLMPGFDGLLEVDSVGSCLAMGHATARFARVVDDNALVGWCAAARRLSFGVWVDPSLKVRHPA